jgi:hypothetical protein
MKTPTEDTPVSERKWTGKKCFACGKAFRGSVAFADTRDGQIVDVGPDCWKRIRSSGEDGFQPKKGGPRLYAEGLKK